MPSVEEQIAAVKLAQAWADRGLPPYAHPEAVAREETRRQRMLEELHARQ